MTDDRILAAYNELADRPKPDRRELFAAPDASVCLGVDRASGPDATAVSIFGIPVHVSPFVPPGEAPTLRRFRLPLTGAIPHMSWPIAIAGEWVVDELRRPKPGRGGRRKRARRNARRGR